jgi:hypothetical protein
VICWMAAVVRWMDRHAGDGEGRGLLPRLCIPCMALESLATEACVLFPAEPRAEADELVAEDLRLLARAQEALQAGTHAELRL